MERAVAGIGLHVNAHKTEYMCYNQTGDISLTEKDIDTWTAIDKLLIIWKSDLTDKMKISFFQAAVVVVHTYSSIDTTPAWKKLRFIL